MSEAIHLTTEEQFAPTPITWIPTSANPSKLRAHKFENGEWVPLAFCKFVPWPEAFPT